MPRIFISYSRVDHLFVDDLADKLRRIYGHDNVWFAEGLHGGDIWWEEILDQIAARDIFIYVLTNESVQSRYCQAEFTEARRLQKQIITVQARDRTRLTDELGDIHYVSMVGGVDDADALTELIRSINKRMTKVPKRRPKPLWEPRTPKPRPIVEKARPHDAPEVETPTLEVPQAERENAPTKPWWKKTEFVIGAVLIPITVALIGILPSLLDLGSGNDPDPSPTTAVAQNLTDIPAGDPTLSGFQQVQTAEAQITQGAQTQAAFALTATEDGLRSAYATATAERIAATETAAYATLLALSATPTPRPTSTPQPPTATFTPEPPTNTPPPSREQIALTPQTSNANWQPYITERNFDGVAMVLVPAGSFEMGSTGDEMDYALELCQQAAASGAACERSWYTDEAPTSTQTFATPFWIDKYEVSRAQYQQCVDAGECDAAPASAYSTAPNQPINRVTWFQAQDYCEWRGARLPTEAEWEYAARGPDGLRFPWGNEFDGTLANHCDRNCGESDWGSGFDYANEENDDGYAITAPVDSYPGGASWVGALNMSGNVWEWVNTLYQSYPYDGTDGRESNEDTGNLRVLRGGSFYDSSFSLRAALRGGNGPVNGNLLIGFRCARSQ